MHMPVRMQIHIACTSKYACNMNAQTYMHIRKKHVHILLRVLVACFVLLKPCMALQTPLRVSEAF